MSHIMMTSLHINRTKRILLCLIGYVCTGVQYVLCTDYILVTMSTEKINCLVEACIAPEQVLTG